MQRCQYILFFLFTISACAQTKPLVLNGYAYEQVRIAGTIATDHDGNPITKGIDTLYTIYLETNTNTAPQVQQILIDNRAYKPSIITLAERRVDVGIGTPNSRRIIVEAKDGNNLWQIDLAEPDNEAAAATPLSDSAINGRVVLKGILNKKQFTKTFPLERLPRFEGL